MHYVLIIGLSVALVAMFAWRAVSLSSGQAGAERTRQAARDAMKAEVRDLLQLSAIPLAWAVGPQLDLPDHGAVASYLDTLVTQPHVRQVAVVDAAGEVLVASDRKLVGLTAASAFPGLSLALAAPRVEERGDDLFVVVPIMDETRQRAAVLIEYDGRSIAGATATWLTP